MSIGRGSTSLQPGKEYPVYPKHRFAEKVPDLTNLIRYDHYSKTICRLGSRIVFVSWSYITGQLQGTIPERRPPPRRLENI